MQPSTVSIPKTREDLLALLIASYETLEAQLDDAGDTVADVRCVDDWTIKDLLAVRAWWTEQVVDWIRAGRAGDKPVVPAVGFKWNETPRLNESVVEAARAEPYGSIRRRLRRGFECAVAQIDALSDHELLEVGVFEWANKWPIARWLSINTARQYATARTRVRRALRTPHATR